MVKRGLVIVLVCVALFAVFVLVNSNSSFSIKKAFTGYAIVDQTLVNNTNYCNDSDFGINYYYPGNVTYLNNLYQRVNSKDYCVGNTLHEYYCGTSIVNGYKTNTYTCPSSCQNGACIYQLKCTTDSDNSANNLNNSYNNFGFVKMIDGSKINDTCYTDPLNKTLIEFGCDNTGNVTFYGHKCSNKCSGGKCI